MLNASTEAKTVLNHNCAKSQLHCFVEILCKAKRKLRESVVSIGSIVFDQSNQVSNYYTLR